MKEFVFSFMTKSEKKLVREVRIKATGMFEAMKQAKDLKKQLEEQTNAFVEVTLKGVAYSM
jgi:hypothetical protein